MRRRWIWILSFAYTLLACAGGGATRNAGDPTRPESRVMLESGGTHQGHWQTLDIAINFEYQQAMDRFDMAGAVELQKRIINFPTLDYLRIRVHFLDAEGVILTTHQLWSAGSGANVFYGLVNFNFTRQYPLPPGAKMIAFSYRGRASDGGYSRMRGGDRTAWDFWWTP
jgi:hypothetical protein